MWSVFIVSVFLFPELARRAKLFTNGNVYIKIRSRAVYTRHCRIRSRAIHTRHCRIGSRAVYTRHCRI